MRALQTLARLRRPECEATVSFDGAIGACCSMSAWRRVREEQREDLGNKG
jgi:hypothetical protein